MPTGPPVCPSPGPPPSRPPSLWPRSTACGIEPEALDRLRTAHAALVERLGTEQTGRAAQVVHGDAHPGNLLATPAGPLWNDFEECMSAPVGWDLACLSRTTRLDGRAVVRAYGAARD
ncbi:phosphotransferase [Nonomuraea fuscirosea]|uniref:phosphotransferase family protein n=1 Tax=Nonomuraea fuscirosea TaxID=1291556 RepID=UPI002DD7CCB1|nr:phosphotransferase [Nonomuraea fuscirosea]WSA58481.1 aminoglycoside phosphotransferase family protein [Nonomuraea fuscirosea]